ncbi:zf-HC2 domain-containing protein [Lentzea sp. NPDC051838]|uniref:zf-HC2 domain-containing protein n=1 Tax=Lentzea sp. NPDC051838 TaxID=3154849 RepID=UPI00341DFE3F
MVTRQPHHEHAHVAGEAGPEDPDDENRTSPEGPCGDVAAYVLGVLDPAQHVIFSRHLAGCESCQRDAADFGMFAPVLRQVVHPPAGHRQRAILGPISGRITRSVLVVAAGVVVAIAAVLTVVESLSAHTVDPVEAGTLTRAESAHSEPFPLFRHV